MKILIAEDDPTSLRMLELVLRRFGHEIVSCSDGEAAWEALQGEGAPQLAILDWMMPGLDGIEICRRLRSRPAVNREYEYLILLTSRGRREDIVAGLEAGADDYITKPFDPEELRVRIRAGQRIVELHSELAQAEAHMRNLAMKDPLTGALNRRSVLELFEAELDRAARMHSTLAVVMADIDHFKVVNDTYGHQAGDQVLCAFVERMRAATRTYDHLGRFGGEEFLLLVPSYPEEAGPALFERLRTTIAEHPMETTEGPISITASFGVAQTTYDPDSEEWSRQSAAERMEALIARADSALYRAKRSGRNRIEFL